jgi:hypothetical protein
MDGFMIVYKRLLGKNGEVEGLVEIKDLNAWHRMYFTEDGEVYTTAVSFDWTPESISGARRNRNRYSFCRAATDELTRRVNSNFAAALLQGEGDFYPVPEEGVKYEDFHLYSELLPAAV